MKITFVSEYSNQRRKNIRIESLFLKRSLNKDKLEGIYKNITTSLSFFSIFSYEKSSIEFVSIYLNTQQLVFFSSYETGFRNKITFNCSYNKQNYTFLSLYGKYTNSQIGNTKLNSTYHSKKMQWLILNSTFVQQKINYISLKCNYGVVKENNIEKFNKQTLNFKSFYFINKQKIINTNMYSFDVDLQNKTINLGGFSEKEEHSMNLNNGIVLNGISNWLEFNLKNFVNLMPFYSLKQVIYFPVLINKLKPVELSLSFRAINEPLRDIYSSSLYLSISVRLPEYNFNEQNIFDVKVEFDKRKNTSFCFVNEFPSIFADIYLTQFNIFKHKEKPFVGNIHNSKSYFYIKNNILKESKTNVSFSVISNKNDDLILLNKNKDAIISTKKLFYIKNNLNIFNIKRDICCLKEKKCKIVRENIYLVTNKTIIFNLFSINKGIHKINTGLKNSFFLCVNNVFEYQKTGNMVFILQRFLFSDNNILNYVYTGVFNNNELINSKMNLNGMYSVSNKLNIDMGRNLNPVLNECHMNYLVGIVLDKIVQKYVNLILPTNLNNVYSVYYQEEKKSKINLGNFYYNENLNINSKILQPYYKKMELKIYNG